MPPVTQIEITLPASTRKELSSRRKVQRGVDETSEISLTEFIREESQRNNRTSGSSSKGWDPHGSDYTLDRVLHNEAENQQFLSESAKEKLLGSSYSLSSRFSHATPASVRSSQEPNKGSSSVSPTVESSDNSAGSTAPRTHRKKVAFYPRVRVQRVMNRADMAEHGLTSIWYTRNEFRDIRQECFETIELMMEEDEIYLEEEGYCSRGLEYKTEEAYKSRTRNKREVRKAVFDEQKFQYGCGMEDAEWIAKLSADQSRSCIKAAIEAARFDEQDARDYLCGPVRPVE